MRIQLNPDPGVTNGTLSSLQTVWRNGIIATRANRFNCLAPNGGRQALTFDVQWVTGNAHQMVRVQPGPARSNMGVWDTNDTGDVAAHEFGHMLGHPDEYADSACPGRSPVTTGTVMDDNTETVARHYHRMAGFHGGGHVPASAAPVPPEPHPEVHVRRTSIDNLRPESKALVLQRLRDMGASGAAPEGAESAEVVFEISGGAPGERYVYRLAVQGDGFAERRIVDELQPGEGEHTGSAVDRNLAGKVFAAAAESGLLDDSAPTPHERGGELLPDSMVAILTVREGNTVRRIAVPAVLGPVLAALRAVEDAL